MFTIGLYDKSIKFLEINKENKISFAYQLTDNFNIENLYSQNKSSDSSVNEASEMINEVLSKSKTTSHTSKLLIDTNYCFANVIPLDFTESNDKINSNILWELSNYFPDNYKNYKVSYHKLLSGLYSEDIKETLIIAIKNSFIYTIKKLSKQINIKISSIDIEHFASEKYFRKIRKNLFDGETIIIIGCKKNRFDLSVINETGCIGYDYFLFEDSNFQDKLVKFYLKNEEKYRNTQINNIYLYGDESTSSAYKIVNDIAKKPRLILSNPFYEIGITENVNSEIVGEGYKFVPLCGLVLN
ncbi:MAG: pilus assembly protein PilM [Ignavibacteriae bacterium]|nr:pilus assembly protein PilM [Ignavibacteriota bacterium]